MNRPWIYPFVAACAIFAPIALSAPPAAEMRAGVERWFADNGPPAEPHAPGPYGDTPWGTTATGGGRVYLFVFDPPADGVLFTPRLGGAVRSAECNGEALPWRAADDGLLVGVPQSPRDGAFEVVAVVFDGPPVVFRPPSFDGPEGAFAGEGSVRLDAGPGIAVRYTMDGSVPTAGSTLADEPIALGDGMEIRARSYYNGRPVSPVVTRKYERMELWASGEPGSGPDLIEEEYAGRWSKVPDFSTMTPRATRTVENFGFANSSMGEFVGLRQRGILRVARDGVYRFVFTCDDGGRVWIDGKLVVDNDGLHVSQTREGAAPLAAGAHAVVVEYFNASGDSSLRLEMGPGPDRMAPVAPADLSHNEGGAEQ